MSYKYEIKELPHSEVEIVCSINPNELDEARLSAVKRFKENTKIDGFRKGNIPEKILIEKLGEAVILEESADIILKKFYPIIIEESKLDVIGKPSISITKLAIGNPFEFKIKIAILPKFELPDYKKIKDDNKKIETKQEASEQEVDNVILQMRKNKAHYDFHKHNKEVESHNHKDFDKEENLPPLDETFAKEVGNFNNVAELKEKVKENIISEKENKEIEKRRAKIMEALVKATKIDLPEILIMSETEKSIAQMKDDISRMSGKWEEYLSHIKKSEDELKKDLRDSSENKAKIQLIFNKIAEKEGLEPDETILEQETKHLKEHYPNADETNIRIYISTMLINQKVLTLLEN